MSDTIKTVADAASVVTVLSAWLGLLSLVATIIATVLAAVWSGIRIYEWYKKHDYHRRHP